MNFSLDTTTDSLGNLGSQHQAHGDLLYAEEPCHVLGTQRDVAQG